MGSKCQKKGHGEVSQTIAKTILVAQVLDASEGWKRRTSNVGRLTEPISGPFSH